MKSDQKCPNCQSNHDVSIFVTGQRVRCSKCGIRFEVIRHDALESSEKDDGKALCQENNNQKKNTENKQEKVQGISDQSSGKSPPGNSEAQSEERMEQKTSKKHEIRISTSTGPDEKSEAKKKKPDFRKEKISGTCRTVNCRVSRKPHVPHRNKADKSEKKNIPVKPEKRGGDGAGKELVFSEKSKGNTGGGMDMKKNGDAGQHLEEKRFSDADDTVDKTAIRGNISIPGFDILQLLGRGGMGEVYLARQESLGRRVAIKVLASHLNDDRDFVLRFDKEALALASLSHPNIVSIIDRGSCNGVLYFVMEYVDGLSLRDILRSGPMEPFQGMRVVADICSAMQYAHNRGVIHRDLKPENILIDQDGNVKVADFGLAGMIGGDRKEHITQTDMSMGTFNYMAPEQRKNARDVDEKADIFSLGVILYEVLTGEVPAGRFKLPGKINNTLDPKIDLIIEKALQIEPVDRYAGAGAFLSDLEPLLGSGGRLSASSFKRNFEEHGVTEKIRRTRKEEKSWITGMVKGAGSVVEKAEKGVVRLAGLAKALAVLAVCTALIVVSVKVVSYLSGDRAAELDYSLVEGRKEESRENDERSERIRSRRASETLIEIPKGPIPVPVRKMSEDSGGYSQRIIDFTDDAGGEMLMHTYRGWWELREGIFLHDVYMQGQGVVSDRLIPRAFIGGERYFFEGYRLDVRLRMDTEPPVTGRRGQGLYSRLMNNLNGYSPQVSIYLYRNMRHYAELAIIMGEDGGYFASYKLDDEEREGDFVPVSRVEPQYGESILLSMSIESGIFHVEVNGVMAGSVNIGELTDENWGKAGVGCHFAVCTFEKIVINGHTRPVPSAETQP